MYGVREPRRPTARPRRVETDHHPRAGEALRRLLTAPERRTNRAARSYLLSGMCRCSKCGNQDVLGIPRYDVRRYLCRSGLDFGGCGSITITAEPTEQIITEMVLLPTRQPRAARRNGRTSPRRRRRAAPCTTRSTPTPRNWPNSPTCGPTDEIDSDRLEARQGHHRDPTRPSPPTTSATYPAPGTSTPTSAKATPSATQWADPQPRPATSHRQDPGRPRRDPPRQSREPAQLPSIVSDPVWRF